MPCGGQKQAAGKSHSFTSLALKSALVQKGNRLNERSFALGSPASLLEAEHLMSGIGYQRPHLSHDAVCVGAC